MLKQNKKQVVSKSNFRLITWLTFFALLMVSFNSLKLNPVWADSNLTRADFFVQPYFDNNASAGANFKDHPDNLWYDNVKPGSKIPVSVLITNQSKESRNFQVSAYTASTNDSGTITYSLVKPKMDSSQKVDFRTLFKNNEVNVKVPGKDTNNGQVAVTLIAQVPNNSFSGLVLGGLNIYAYDPTNKQKKSQTSLVNKFRFVIPVAFEVNTSFEKQRVKKQDALKLEAVVPYVETQGRDNVVNVKAGIHNTKSATVGNFQTYAAVTRKGEKKIQATASTEANQIAPNSVWNFPILWGDQGVKSVTYHITVKFRSTNNGPVKNTTPVSKKYDWKLEKDFTITGAQANQFNRQLGIKPNYLWLWITLGVLLAILIILLVWYLARRTKKNKQV